jgi:hypothetical protein
VRAGGHLRLGAVFLRGQASSTEATHKQLPALGSSQGAGNQMLGPSRGCLTLDQQQGLFADVFSCPSHTSPVGRTPLTSAGSSCFASCLNISSRAEYCRTPTTMGRICRQRVRGDGRRKGCVAVGVRAYVRACVCASRRAHIRRLCRTGDSCGWGKGCAPLPLVASTVLMPGRQCCASTRCCFRCLLLPLHRSSPGCQGTASTAAAPRQPTGAGRSTEKEGFWVMSCCC